MTPVLPMTSSMSRRRRPQPSIVCCKRVKPVYHNRHSIMIPKHAVAAVKETAGILIPLDNNLDLTSKRADCLIDLHQVYLNGNYSARRQLMAISTSDPVQLSSLPMGSLTLLRSSGYERHDTFVEFKCTKHPTMVFVAWEWHRVDMAPRILRALNNLERCLRCKRLGYGSRAGICTECRIFSAAQSIYDSVKSQEEASMRLTEQMAKEMDLELTKQLRTYNWMHDKDRLGAKGLHMVVQEMEGQRSSDCEPHEKTV